VSDIANLCQWHWDIADRISDHATYGVIPVVTEYPKDRTVSDMWTQQVNKLYKALTGDDTTSGLAVFVTLPRIQSESKKIQSITAEIVCEVSVIELRFYNAATTGFAPSGVGIHADDAAIGIARYLQNWKDSGVADRLRVGTIVANQEGWIPPELRRGFERFDMVVVAFDVRAIVSFTQPTRCYIPAIAFAGSPTITCTLTCATAGTTIRYTIDGTCPTSASTAYSAPFTVTAGKTVRAIAYKTGSESSDVAIGVAA